VGLSLHGLDIKRFKMFGIIGSILIMLQMASLSLGYPREVAMYFSIVASLFWIVHSIQHKDKCLLFTTNVVMGFSIWGLVA